MSRAPALAAGLLLILAGCASQPPAHVSDNFCANRIERPMIAFHEVRAGQAEALVARGITQDSVDTATHIGALGVLDALLAAETQGRPGIPLLLARQALTDRIMLAILDVNATLGAIDCEGERGDQLRGQLQRREARRARNLGIAGMLVGAGTAALSGGLSLWGASNSGDIAGIIGGSLGAAVGGALLFDPAEGTLRSRTNLLAEIYQPPEHSTLFPPTVWRYLTHRDAPGEANLVEEVMAEWRSAGLINEGDDGDPLFAETGTFTVNDLERRDAMLDLLEARIALMSRDLRALLAEVVERPLAPPAPRRRVQASGFTRP